MHRFEKTRLANMKSRDVTSSRQKNPCFKAAPYQGTQNVLRSIFCNFASSRSACAQKSL